ATPVIGAVRAAALGVEWVEGVQRIEHQKIGPLPGRQWNQFAQIPQIADAPIMGGAQRVELYRESPQAFALLRPVRFVAARRCQNQRGAAYRMNRVTVHGQSMVAQRQLPGLQRPQRQLPGTETCAINVSDILLCQPGRYKLALELAAIFGLHAPVPDMLERVTGHVHGDEIRSPFSQDHQWREHLLPAVIDNTPQLLLHESVVQYAILIEQPHAFDIEDVQAICQGYGRHVPRVFDVLACYTMCLQQAG